MNTSTRFLRLIRNLWKVFEDLIAILPAPAWWVLAGGYAVLLLYVGGRPGSELPLPSRMPPHADKVLHFLAYGLLAALLFRAVYPLNPHRPPRMKAAPWIVVLVPTAVGIVDEIHQLFVPGRTAELLDVVADALGAVAVLLVGLAWRRHARKGTPPPGKRQRRKRRKPPDSDRGTRT